LGQIFSTKLHRFRQNVTNCGCPGEGPRRRGKQRIFATRVQLASWGEAAGDDEARSAWQSLFDLPASHIERFRSNYTLKKSNAIGPYVMNTEQEVRQALQDEQLGRMGRVSART
jgi:hypothetical protein